MKQKKINSLVMIGAGNVATHMALALHENGLKIDQVWSRTKESALALAARLKTSICTDLSLIETNADLYIISTPDNTIDGVVEQLSQLNDQLVVHTSGTIPMKSLKPISKNYGVLYPLQTFSKKKDIIFENIPILVEANNEESFEKLFVLAKVLSKSVQHLDSEKRAILHLAAVFASNFPNYLYSVADDLLQENDLSFNLLKPLIMETGTKVMDSKPSVVQTGPAVRKDHTTINKHLEMLSGNPEYRKLYKLMSKMICDPDKP